MLGRGGLVVSGLVLLLYHCVQELNKVFFLPFHYVKFIQSVGTTHVVFCGDYAASSTSKFFARLLSQSPQTTSEATNNGHSPPQQEGEKNNKVIWFARSTDLH